ncbi:MAG: hypothetical protein MUO72_18445 [Bacteroidales bacterium]|nr:hypothetical protein [Bacteroidales bacterium]
MTEDEFWDITPRAFFNAVEGHQAERQMELEVMRLQTARIMECWSTKNTTIDPKKLWKYPWESEKKQQINLEKQIHRAKRIAEKMERIEKRGNIEEI